MLELMATCIMHHDYQRWGVLGRAAFLANAPGLPLSLEAYTVAVLRASETSRKAILLLAIKR